MSKKIKINVKCPYCDKETTFDGNDTLRSYESNAVCKECKEKFNVKFYAYAKVVAEEL